MCECYPAQIDGYQYNSFIGNYFADCIYTPQEQVSFAFAYVGLVASVTSILPQFLLNYKLKSVQGLSFYLLLFWMLGDFGSLLGSILTAQLQPQIVTAFVFFVMDFSMCIQYGYYEYARPYLLGYQVIEREATDADEVVVEEPAAPTNDASNVIGVSIPGGIGVALAAVIPTTSAFSIASPSLLILQSMQSIAAISIPICNQTSIISDEAKVIGYLLSWFSGLFYFTSRIPQVWKNYKNKTVEGLSFYLFFLTIIGNIGYGVSVSLRMPVLDERFYLATLPFLIGSLGVLLFDFFTLGQFYWYRWQRC
jgi:hypothetical protein